MPEGDSKSAPGTLATSANLDNQLAHIDELRASLDQILAMKDTPTPEMRILQQLWVDDMYAREDKIQKAEGETFQWILGNSDKNGVDTKSEPLETEDAEGNQNDEKPSSSNSQSPWYVDTEVRKLRENKRSILQDWLKHGSNVFHISGKAGSGKSTLMKLIVDDQRTYDFLQDWAGGKELITAQFFFWRAGSDVQRSRQGLYRCLLFEILKECPYLIRKVFPGTYKIFERKSRANTIDQSFFRPEHIATAFQTLVSLSPTFDHRMCLFIDGLDEYGDDTVDSYEYENLAKSLAIWTKNDHIKILCSSRPHREFLDRFTEDLRIHLHEVNAPDIQLFSRQMFEKDDQFLSIKDQYVDLVQNIVSHSAGVFLWARLVVRSLIASIHRRDPVDSLKAQLEVAPKDLNKLYEHFFVSISKPDQERAFRMLLLVAHHYSNQVNALFLSWLDHLHEPKFPTTCEIKPYTDQEIQKKLEDVQRQIAGLTHGLLEIRVITHGTGLFFSRSIQFFHRSARDFVLQNSQLQKFQTEHPETISPDTYLRLDLAELWFASSATLEKSEEYYYMSSGGNYHQGVSAPELLQAVAKIRAHHNSNASQYVFPASEIYFERLSVQMITSVPGLPESTLHYILRIFDDASGYIQALAADRPQLLEGQKGSFYLMTACFSSYLANVRCLLHLGVSPRDLVAVHYEPRLPAKDRAQSQMGHKSDSCIPLWSCFLVLYMTKCLRRPIPSPGKKSSEAHEYVLWIWDLALLLLEHGGYGSSSFFLLSQKTNNSGPVYYVISLRELIRQRRPRNEEALIQLIDKEESGSFWTSIWPKWYKVREAKTETIFDPSQYEPFHVSMFEENTGDWFASETFDLYSVWSAGCETKAKNLTVRVT